MRTEGALHPLISVVLPVFNAERYVAECIRSILAQTHSYFELIIVDDGSTDASPRIIKDFAARDSRIQPVFLSHRGQSYALNAGVALAQGDFIAHMDNDDIALPHRLEVQLAWMLEQRVDLCGGWLRRFGDQGGFLWFPETHEAICSELLFRIAVHHGTSLVRSETAKSYPFAEDVFHTDYEMLTRLAPCRTLSNIPQILLKHRRHSQQANVVYRSAFTDDLRNYRRRYFFNMFPEATEADHAAVARLAVRASFSTLGELELAGDWLVRLAQPPDRYLRRRMARRWLEACLASAHLGPSCYHLYGDIARRFDIDAVDKAFRLRIASLVRVRSGSKAYAVAAAVRRSVKRIGAGKRRKAFVGPAADPSDFQGHGPAAEPSRNELIAR